MVSSSTQGLLGHCTAGDRGTGMVVMEGPCHIAAIYVAPKTNYIYSLLWTREMSGLKKKKAILNCEQLTLNMICSAERLCPCPPKPLHVCTWCLYSWGSHPFTLSSASLLTLALSFTLQQCGWPQTYYDFIRREQLYIEGHLGKQ